MRDVIQEDLGKPISKPSPTVDAGEEGWDHAALCKWNNALASTPNRPVNILKATWA